MHNTYTRTHNTPATNNSLRSTRRETPHRREGFKLSDAKEKEVVDHMDL